MLSADMKAGKVGVFYGWLNHAIITNAAELFRGTQNRCLSLVSPIQNELP